MDEIFNIDCMEYMKSMAGESVDLTLTDIPYDSANRDSNGLRDLDKREADIITFDLNEFLREVDRVTKGTIIIFCGKEQFSTIFGYFSDKQNKGEGTVRQLIWQKSNPSPMNGQSVYLSGIENAVWFKKSGATFNAHCKNTVFTYPCGESKVHPTEKNHSLLQELILDNSNEGDIVFDPCCGSGSHLLIAKNHDRKWLGCELSAEWFKVASNRLNKISIFDDFE